MKQRVAALALAVVTACATSPAYSRGLAKIGPEHVREQLGEVQYISGHRETDEHYPRAVRDGEVRGMLVATDTALVLVDAHDPGSWLTLPLRTVVTTDDAVETGGATVAGRVLFGVLATGSRDETVTVKRNLGETVEVVVFKVSQRGSAPGIAAKIDFHAKRVREAAAP